MITASKQITPSLAPEHSLQRQGLAGGDGARQCEEHQRPDGGEAKGAPLDPPSLHDTVRALKGIGQEFPTHSGLTDGLLCPIIRTGERRNEEDLVLLIDTKGIESMNMTISKGYGTHIY